MERIWKQLFELRKWTIFSADDPRSNESDSMNIWVIFHCIDPLASSEYRFEQKKLWLQAQL